MTAMLAEKTCTPCPVRVKMPYRTYRFANFAEVALFVRRAANLAEAEAHHPDISFGWGYATVSLRTKKIKGLHENDFIMAVKFDRLAADVAPQRKAS
jgi:4a-hydroxytetrahydrobiopterin dehydratase